MTVDAPLATEDLLARRRADHEAAPDDPIARCRLAEALLRAGRAGEACSLLDRDHPTIAERTGLAAALIALDRHRRADRLLREVLELDPAHPDALRLSAEVLLEHGRPAEALEPLARLLHTRPEDPGGLVRLARAQAELGAEEDAIRTLDRTVTIDPYHGEAHAALAPLLERAGRTDSAEEARSIARTLGAGASRPPADGDADPEADPAAEAPPADEPDGGPSE